MNGLVICQWTESGVESGVIRARTDVKVAYGEEIDLKSKVFEKLERIVRAIGEEFNEKITEPPLLVLPDADKLATSHSPPGLDTLEPPPGSISTLIQSQFLSLIDSQRPEESTIIEDVKTDEDTQEFSFFNLSPKDQIQDSLFVGEILGEMEEAEGGAEGGTEDGGKEAGGKEAQAQDLDLVPKKPEGKPPIFRRVSESILTKVSRKPPVYPKKPNEPKPAFTRRVGASSLHRTKSLKNLTSDEPPFDTVPNMGIFTLTHSQLEQYALQYHRPRRTGLMYNASEGED